MAAPVTTESDFRLPRTVLPLHYELTIAPDLQAFTFDGVETVTVEIHESVREIVCNAAELSITSASLRSGDLTIDATVALDETRERATISLANTADPGQWQLTLAFTGILNDKLAGFYRSTFTDAEGNERVIATTQFESTDARRAFPCWDEPDFKAVFGITLVVDEGLAAISNGPVERDTPLDNRPGKRAVTFADTMKMSTYLVAFVVGPLEFTDPVDVDGTPLRVAFVPGKGHLTAFALEAGAHSLRFFHEYFDIPYPGDKLDLIALPDFAFGAMENLGCVTFRETALLVDPDIASRLEHERVADVVAHEIAHMWFGDLVTMKWWNGIWLNEAFATFMELLAVDAFRPEWERWVSFSTGRAAAQNTDGMRATRPVEFPVTAPEEAEGMFDVLTYQKGASVVRMLEQYLGAETFRSGIRLYMRKHAYGNTETTDLWDAIEEASGEPVRSTMDSWIFQGGYPVVTVDTTEAGGVELNQRRFRYLPGPDDGDARWQVPVLLRASVDGKVGTRKLLLAEGVATIEFGDSKVDWVVVNAGGSGFYRTRYSAELLRQLTADLDAAQLSAVERFNLVSDTWAAVWAGLAQVDDFTELVRLFGDETDPTVWSAMLSPFSLFERALPADQREGLQAFVRRLAGPAFARVGWTATPGEGETVATLRSILLAALATVGADPDIRWRAGELHASYLLDRSAVEADIVPALVSIASSTGGEAEYQQFLDRYRDPATPQEEVRYLMALANFPNEALLQRTLDLASDEVRTQNAPYLIGAAMANREHGETAWRWLTHRWSDLLSRFPDNSHARMLESISSLPPQLAGDVRAFLSDHPIKAGQKTVEQTLERLDVNAAFRRRESEGLVRVFAEGS